MTDIIDAVFTFNEQVIGINRNEVKPIAEDEMLWLVDAVGEEMLELAKAFKEDDLVGQIDALVDLMYFSIGGLKRLGLTRSQAEQVFAAVHACNITKVKGVKPTRGHKLDAIKPDSWISPELKIKKIIIEE